MYLWIIHLGRDIAFRLISLIALLITELSNLPFINSFNCDIHEQGRDFRDWYDFIVVGGGSTGSVVASRLSEIHGWNVLLLEAGGMEPLFSNLPVFVAFAQQGPLDWKYKIELQSDTSKPAGDGKPYPRGKVIGGTSVFNGMIYCRGNRLDYDNWAAAGNPEWSYDNVLPYFKKSEDMRIKEYVNSSFHGTGGYMSIEYFKYYDPLYYEIQEAIQELGYNFIDVNGESQNGFTLSHATANNGYRISSYKAFLKPVAKRTNLDISLNSHVEKILIDPISKMTEGVIFKKNGITYNICVRKEVIISGGTVNSPQLLMLSGIGQKDHLSNVGISQIIADLRVGDNLHDHVGLGGLVFTLENTSSSAIPSLNFLMGTGVQMFGFTNTIYSNSSHYPDFGHYFSVVPDNFDGGIFLPNYLGYSYDFYDHVFSHISFKKSFLIYSVLQRPKSRGYIRLKDNNPLSHPLIFSNMLSHPDDVKTIIDGAKFGFKLLETATMKKLGAKFNDKKFLGCEHLDIISDEYLECALRQYSVNLWHAAGTCKMGPDSDPDAVVTSKLNVRGVKRLRVADASIMPTSVTGNLHAPCMMIGEMVSDFIKKEWLQDNST